MALDETSALDVIAVRRLETDDLTRTLWTDADRAWAGRAAAEVVGEGGTAEDFLAQRAQLALGRISERYKVLPRAVRALRWRGWVGAFIVIAAFIAGVAIDTIGSAQRINVLAPPVLALLVWNLAVYVLLLVGLVARYRKAPVAGALRSAVTRLATGLLKPRGSGQAGAVVVRLVDDWARISAPVYGTRAARILHFAAAALAAGVLAGLYRHGIALEYRASWEITFLNAESVYRVLEIALAPGAALTGIPVPGVPEIEAIRAPGGENAARWLHLIAATVALLVIVPRLILALVAWLVERHRSSRLPLVLDEPYFQRLLRGFRGGPARVHILPYSYTMPPAVMAGLERLVARAFGGSAAMTTAAPVTYGGEDALATARARYEGTVIALFNATATPEREAHGAFLAAIAGTRGPSGTVVALVDESAFRARLGTEPARLEERRQAWRELSADRQVPCAFADLMAADVTEAQAALERALEETTR